MSEFELLAVSPIDGRYSCRTSPLSHYFSELGLIKYRVFVEIEWLKAVLSIPEFKIPPVSSEAITFLNSISTSFSLSDARRVKDIEKTTNHDVKAVEYFIKEKLASNPTTLSLQEYVHFTCTSEDINNLAYALMIKESLVMVIVPKLSQLLSNLSSLAQSTATTPLMALTHGQPATPTTFGRELTVFIHRLKHQLQNLSRIQIKGKFNGATGSFNAHSVAYPAIDWPALAETFVTKSLNLIYQPVSTQIECHDYISEISDVVSRMSNILTGFSRDMWMYISRGVLKLRVVPGEVGSSTMPHKVNPIDFENAEGNFGIAVALFNHFSDKLIVSRLQRDLSDSTVLRNIGVGFGHFLIAIDSLTKGVAKVDVNLEVCERELNANWSLLAEPVQTVMRKGGIEKPYEKLKEFSRGTEIDEIKMREFIDSLAGRQLAEEDLDVLRSLTPWTYIGYAEKICRDYGQL